MEAESEGTVFFVYGKERLLSAGRIQSPYLLILSGVRPEYQLCEAGIDLMHELPGGEAELEELPLG